METSLVALLSVVLRAATSVIDRHNFGIRGQSIFLMNLINNFAPFLILLLLLYSSKTAELLNSLFSDSKMIVFSFSVQLVAFAFSYGFKYFTVSKVNVAARAGDIFIPLALLVNGAKVSLIDFLFSLSISSIVFVTVRSKFVGAGSLLKPALMITSALVIQSLCGEYAFSSGAGAAQDSLVSCAKILFWRSVVCVIPSIFFYIIKRVKFSGNFVTRRKVIVQIVYRSFFTIGSQATFIYCLSRGNRMVAWPILNAVAVFSVFIASITIQEKPEKKEWLAVSGIVAISCLRGLLK